MSTPIVTARRNLVQRIATLLRKAEAGDVKLSPWQLCAVQQAISQLEEERFSAGERTMAEAERADLYEPAGFIADPINRRHLLDQLAAVAAAA
jgi:hypothetical protein